jgi:hypothetical protein
MYPSVFPKRAVDYYLTRFWLVRFVSRHARGAGPERQYMKFFVAHAIWDRVGSVINASAPHFIHAAERHRLDESPLWELERTTERTFKSVERFFGKNRKEDGKVLKVYAFFKRRGKYTEYLSFMRQSEQRALAGQIKKADDDLIAALT